MSPRNRVWKALPLAAVVLAMAASPALAVTDWYWGNASTYVGMCGGCSSPAGPGNQWTSNRADNQNSGTDKVIARHFPGGSVTQWYARNYGYPQFWVINYSSSGSSAGQCWNNTGNPIALRCATSM